MLVADSPEKLKKAQSKNVEGIQPDDIKNWDDFMDDFTDLCTMKDIVPAHRAKFQAAQSKDELSELVKTATKARRCLMSAFKQIAKESKAAQLKVQVALDAKDKKRADDAILDGNAVAGAARASASAAVAARRTSTAEQAQRSSTLPPIYAAVDECSALPKMLLEAKDFEQQRETLLNFATSLRHRQFHAR
jgi:hypothetical protein